MTTTKPARVYLVTLTATCGLFLSAPIPTKANGTWVSQPNMSVGRAYHAATSIGSIVYSVGGAVSPGGAIQSFEAYNTSSGQWSGLSNLPTPRSSLAAAAIDGKVYVVGGWSGSTRVGTLDIYNPATNLWTRGLDMPTARNGMAAVSIGDKLYVVGGQDNSGVRIGALEIYNPSTNQWSTGPSMPTGRDALAAAVIGTKLYVVGGSTTGEGSAIGKMEIFDTIANQWSTGPDMPTARYWLAAGTINGRIWVVGGSGVGTVVEIYNPATNQWITGTSLPTSRAALAATTIGNTLYIIGGTGAGFLATVVAYTEALAETAVSGTITTTTWSAENSPYRVTGTITVPSGNTLTIEPGVDVLFDADVQFIVQGKLNAIGTEADSIRFAPGTASEWSGIRIYGGDSSTIAYARIRGARTNNGNQADTLAYGGAIYMRDSRLRLSHVVLGDNWANWGGAIHTRGDFNLLDLNTCDVRGNIAKNGNAGGIFIHDKGTLIMTDCTIRNNHVEAFGTHGGALSTSIARVYATRCVFSGNSAEADGGCLHFGPGTVATLSHCVITGNTATRQRGGGLFAFSGPPSDSTIVTAENCTFADNDAGESGGQIYVYPSTRVSIRSSIVRGLPGKSVVGFYGSGVLKSTYSDIQGVYPGTGNIDADPLFENVAAGDYRLKGLESPCVDTGDPASPLDPDGTRADMGAFPYTHTGMETEWKTLAPMPTARWVLAAVSVGGRIYVVGGRNGSQYYGTLEIYDPSNDTWTTGAPMPTARERLAVAVINGKIFAVGGDGGPSGHLNVLEVYDPITNTWTTGTPMPTARSAPAAASLNGRLYVVGGDGESGQLKTVEIYDPSTNTWAPGSPMPTARSGMGAAVIGGKLFCVAGYNGEYLNTLEVFDPGTGMWATAPSAPTGRHLLAAAVVNGRLYVTGGVDLNTVDVYDPATSVWSSGPPMDTERRGHAAVAIDGRLYAIGGLGTSGTMNTMLELPNTNRPPVWSARPDISGLENSPISFTVSATDPDGDSLTYAAPAIPAGATFTPSTRTFSWTPPYSWVPWTDTSRVFDAVFTVADSEYTARDTVTITVANVNRAPTWTRHPDRTGAEASPLSFTLDAAVDPDVAPIRYSMPTIPAGATFDPVTRVFSWTPTYRQAGIHMAIFAARDTFAVNERIFTVRDTVWLTIANTPLPPFTIIPTGDSVVAGRTVTLTVRASDPALDSLDFTADPRPRGSTFNPKTHVFTWTRCASQSADTVVRFNASDTEKTVSRTVPLRAGMANRLPTVTWEGTIPDTVSWDTDLSVSVADLDYDMAGLLFQVSTNSGATWTTMSLIGDTARAPTPRSVTVTWRTFEQFPGRCLSAVRIRCAAKDTEAGSRSERTVRVLNLRADFSRDGMIGLADFDILRSAFTARDTTKNLGPYRLATGDAAPNFSVTQDRKIDFDDMMGFVAQWDWACTRGRVERIARFASRPAGESGAQLVRVRAADANPSVVEILGPDDMASNVLGFAIRMPVGTLAKSTLSRGEWTGADGWWLCRTDSAAGVVEVWAARTPGASLSPVLARLILPAGLETATMDVYWQVPRGTDDADAAGAYAIDLRVAPLPAAWAMTVAPNPFNPATTIRYDVPSRAHVRLVVADVLGRRVATLVDEPREPGRHVVQWNGTDGAGRAVASGVYIVRLEAGETRIVSRVAFVR